MHNYLHSVLISLFNRQKQTHWFKKKKKKKHEQSIWSINLSRNVLHTEKKLVKHAKNQTKWKRTPAQLLLHPRHTTALEAQWSVAVRGIWSRTFNSTLGGHVAHSTGVERTLQTVASRRSDWMPIELRVRLVVRSHSLHNNSAAEPNDIISPIPCAPTEPRDFEWGTELLLIARTQGWMNVLRAR